MRSPRARPRRRTPDASRARSSLCSPTPGLLGLPYDAEYGGGGAAIRVYLQVLEELAAARLTVGLGVSVHTLASYALAAYGTKEQQIEHLPAMLGGGLLGAYCLSNPPPAPDAASLRTKAVRDGDDWVLTGTKAWITHGGIADFYTVMARTGRGPRGITAFLVPGDAEGLSAAVPEKKMGLKGSPTAQVHLDGVRVPRRPAPRRRGSGLRDRPVRTRLRAAGHRRLRHRCGPGGAGRGGVVRGRPAAVRQADLRLPGTALHARRHWRPRSKAGRALYLTAARLRDAGLPFAKQAAMAKLHCTDTAMRATTDAVQILGGYGYTADFPAERYMREAKVLQIVEGTSQIQRMVIARHLAGPEGTLKVPATRKSPVVNRSPVVEKSPRPRGGAAGGPTPGRGAPARMRPRSAQVRISSR